MSLSVRLIMMMMMIMMNNMMIMIISVSLNALKCQPSAMSALSVTNLDTAS